MEMGYEDGVDSVRGRDGSPPRSCIDKNGATTAVNRPNVAVPLVRHQRTERASSDELDRARDTHASDYRAGHQSTPESRFATL